MGDDIACVDCACMLPVETTRVRRLVANCGCIILRCFAGGVDDCGGGCDGKEVDMEAILCVGFFAFFVGLMAGATLAYAVLSAREDKILESSNELFDSFGKTMIYSMDKMYEYGQKVKELEDKGLNEWLRKHNGGVVPPNKKYEDFITRSETVVDINKLKEVFEKEQQKQ